MASVSNSAANNPYDQVPYPSWPFRDSHPSCLGAIARVFGLTPTPLDRARVLELGCASGGNLVPMAEMYPHATFLGIDYSMGEISEGEQHIAQVGFPNIQLRHQNILEFSRAEGEFDYIIAHGVFSWVPDVVRTRVLEICRDHLADHGLAFISYNALPGWKTRGMIRDMLTYHCRQFHDPQKQVEQARAFLHFMAQSVPEDSLYGKLVKHESQSVAALADQLIFHDQLEGDNTPFYFHEFMARAEAHDLQYVGEPRLAAMATTLFAPEVDNVLRQISRDVIQLEQYMDFLKHRMFRQTILCRSDIDIDRTIQPSVLRDLYFSTPLREADGTASEAGEVTFVHGEKSMRTASPRLIGAIRTLIERKPACGSFSELWERCQRRDGGNATGTGPRTDSPDDLTAELMECCITGLVNIHTAAPPVQHELGKYPQASRWARYQAAHHPSATNQHHQLIELDPLTRDVLTVLDGTRDEMLIVAELQRRVDAGVATYLLPDSQQETLSLVEMVRAALKALCRSGFMVK